jgi:hypothetical protein
MAQALLRAPYSAPMLWPCRSILAARYLSLLCTAPSLTLSPLLKQLPPTPHFVPPSPLCTPQQMTAAAVHSG